jgi:hypothetical protein
VANPGDTVSVAAGSYASQSISYSAAKLGATQRVVFQCAANFSSSLGANLGLRGAQHVEFVGCNLGQLSAQALDRTDPASPEATDFVVRDGKLKDFYVTGAQHWVIQNNDIGHYSVDGDGLGVSSVYSDNGQPTLFDGKILGNTFSGITVITPSHNECLFVKRVDTLVIAGNKFIGCPGLAIAFYDAQLDPAKGYAHASNVTVENNFLQCRPLTTCYGGSYAVQADTKGQERFINFVFRFNSSDGGLVMGGCDATLCQNVKAYGNAGNVGSGWPVRFNNVPNPLFVDQPEGDFHEAVGSPSIDGIPLSICQLNPCPATDVDGQLRSLGATFDAGADER